MNKANILLATFNSEPFLETLFESIAKQTTQEFRVVVEDDGSTDGTIQWLERAQGEMPFELDITVDGQQKGPCQRFASLLMNSQAPFDLLCDHDDFWMPTKVERTLALLRQLEAQGPRPTMVHGNALVWDGQEVGPSIWKLQAQDPASVCNFGMELVQNHALGGTIGINREMRSLVVPIPESAIMHDWWIGIVASAYASIGYLEEPCMLYRQHGGNHTGANRYGAMQVLKRFSQIGKTRERVWAKVDQAKGFVERFSGLPTPAFAVAETLATIEALRGAKRAAQLRKAGVVMSTALRTNSLYALMRRRPPPL